MEVVKNTCYGGYGLSKMALIGLSQITGKRLSDCEDEYGYTNDPEVRSSPELVQVVKELGCLANGLCADLKVVEVPDDVDWVIDDYDGWESLEEVHRSW